MVEEILNDVVRSGGMEKGTTLIRKEDIGDVPDLTFNVKDVFNKRF